MASLLWLVGIWLKAGILGHGVAGAGLGDTREFAVAHDAGVGILIVKIAQQFEEGMLLLFSTSVGSVAFFIIAAFVAYADRALVIVLGMGTLHILGQNRIDFAIAMYIVVVAGLAEAGIACGNKAFDREGLIAATAGAVNDQKLHVLMFEGFQRLCHFFKKNFRVDLAGHSSARRLFPRLL